MQARFGARGVSSCLSIRLFSHSVLSLGQTTQRKAGASLSHHTTMFARTDFRSCRIRFNQRLHKRHTQLIPIEVGMASESNPDCFRSCMTRAYQQSHRSPLDRIGSVIVSGIAHPVKVSGGCEVLRSKGPHDKASCSEKGIFPQHLTTECRSVLKVSRTLQY